MRNWLLVGASALALMLTSCGGAAKRPAMKRMDGSPRAQINELFDQNLSLGRQLGLRHHENGTTDSAPPTTAGAASKRPATRPQVKTSPPPGPAASSCDDVCRITASICNNAERICRIAREKLPDDPWARDKCREAKRSCSDARARCTACRRH